MPSTYSLHLVHPWLSDETDFLRSASNRVGISFSPSKKQTAFYPIASSPGCDITSSCSAPNGLRSAARKLNTQLSRTGNTPIENWLNQTGRSAHFRFSEPAEAPLGTAAT
jgi:hypothetical protein